MCNCGNNRVRLARETPNKQKDNRSSLQPHVWKDAYFKYVGETALTVAGRITGKHYRFQSKGDVQTVDYRDVTAMMAIPVLERIV
ncbi:MAG TPA: hypothetical protein VG847_07155 [Chitinophagaceae bacterium]|nr:hypothetical protein [Chitinophagaceae bacterium]